jgi:hypothetical protein
MSEYSYNINYGYTNYDSTMAPFFIQVPNNDFSINNTLSIIEDNYIDIINDFKMLYLEKNINDFFLHNEAYNKEIYINEYTFFSIKKILELSQFYKNNNITNIIDIGFTYQGMGWIKVIYYNTKFNKLFFRMDGGSNDFDRLDNYNLLKKIANETDINLINSQSYDFKDIIF